MLQPAIDINNSAERFEISSLCIDTVHGKFAADCDYSEQAFTLKFLCRIWPLSQSYKDIFSIKLRYAHI